jgi:hypothetical protein
VHPEQGGAHELSKARPVTNRTSQRGRIAKLSCDVRNSPWRLSDSGPPALSPHRELDLARPTFDARCVFLRFGPRNFRVMYVKYLEAE